MRNHLPMYAGILSIAALTSLGTAQISQASVNIGGNGAIDCGLHTTPPTLGDGTTEGTAVFDYTYDQSNGMLQLVVSNTSPDVPGVNNPLISRILFNLPAGAVDSVMLLSQSTSEGPLGFTMAVDLDTSTPDAATKLGCIGYFNVSLTDVNVMISNPNATTIWRPASGYSEGPATFVFQLGGPGIGVIDATIIASSNSQGGAFSGYNAACHFQSGGANGAFSGLISAQQPDCIPSMWTSAPAEIGTTIEMCFGASSGCHGCLLVSHTPGPVPFGGYILPIGLPVVIAIPLPDFTQSAQCYPLMIPNDPMLVGFTVYMTLATTDFGIQFSSPAFELTVTN